jgi:hypothetical protein
MSSYLKFSGRYAENYLIVTALSSYTFYGTENFPLVKVIGRSGRISPDIDILTIRDRDKKEISAKLIGYEAKILHPDENGNIKREDFYQGIGEAIFYLQYGLNQCGLILGFHKNLSDEKIEKFLTDLDKEREFLKYVFGSRLGYFNLYIVTTGENGFLKEIIKAEWDFSQYFHNPPENEMKEKMKKYRKLFVEKEFKWSTNLAKKCKYAVIT